MTIQLFSPKTYHQYQHIHSQYQVPTASIIIIYSKKRNETKKRHFKTFSTSSNLTGTTILVPSLLSLPLGGTISHYVGQPGQKLILIFFSLNIKVVCARNNSTSSWLSSVQKHLLVLYSWLRIGRGLRCQVTIKAHCKDPMKESL